MFVWEKIKTPLFLQICEEMWENKTKEKFSKSTLTTSIKCYKNSMFTKEQSEWFLPEVEIGCTNLVAMIINCNDYIISTLKKRFQSTGNINSRPRPEKSRVTTRI